MRWYPSHCDAWNMAEFCWWSLRDGCYGMGQARGQTLVWGTLRWVPGQEKLRGDSLPVRAILTRLGFILNPRTVSRAAFFGRIWRGRSMSNWSLAARFLIQKTFYWGFQVVMLLRVWGQTELWLCTLENKLQMFSSLPLCYAKISESLLLYWDKSCRATDTFWFCCAELRRLRTQSLWTWSWLRKSGRKSTRRRRTKIRV